LKPFKSSSFYRRKFYDNFISLKYLFLVDLFSNIYGYRDYFEWLKKGLKEFTRRLVEWNNIHIVLVYKTNPKTWSFRFVMKGLSWRTRYEKAKTTLEILELINKRPFPHSNGLRIRKARRV
jgi:hypothetical protein